MAVLKLGAVDLGYCAGIVQQRLSRRLYDASFAGTRRPQEEKISYRPAGRRQSGHVSLVSPHDLVNCFVLANDKVVELVLQILRLLSRLSGI